jgi:hypothetical protein
MAAGWLWVYWPFALALIAIVLFGVPEAVAFRSKTAGPTFSRFMWHMHQKFPFWTLAWGMLIGGLAVHFLWHWCPDGAGVG